MLLSDKAKNSQNFKIIGFLMKDDLTTIKCSGGFTAAFYNVRKRTII